MQFYFVLFSFLGLVSAQPSLNDALGYGPNNPASLQLETYRQQNANILNYTSASGSLVYDPGNVLSAGQRGPMLVQDTTFFNEFQHFDRERIPERVVHAKGSGAMGYFLNTHDMSSVTRAVLFTQVGQKTPVAVRFSQVGEESGGADTVRDARGFAVKFYTSEGNFDIPGLNFPVFWVRDPLLFPSFVHASKRNPVTHLHDPGMIWDFLSLTPETAFITLFVYSDLGIPASYRHMNGFGPNTYALTTSNGEYVFCVQGMDPATATQLAGIDPDYYMRDLYNSIAKGQFPSWNVSLQIMTQQQAQNFTWNPFDIWPTNEFPHQPVGILELNQNPTDYFSQVEQIGFCPTRLIPGIEPSPDKILQGRMFSYTDTLMYRLGVNHELLPINAPHRAPYVANRQRDGRSRSDSNQAGEPNYYPNSYNGPEGNIWGKPAPFPVSGLATTYNTSDSDNFSQVQIFWSQTFTQDERNRVVQNIAGSLALAPPYIQERAVRNFYNIGEDMGQMVAQALGISVSSASGS